MKKLGDITDMLIGYAFKSQFFLDHKSEGVKLLRGDNVQQGYIRWGEKTKKWPKSDTEHLDRYFLKEGDIILAMDRPIVGGGLKLSCVTNNDLPSLLVQRVCRLRGKESVSLTDYIKYALSTKEFSDHIDRITTGANIPHISGKDIAAYELNLPSLDDQRSIVLHLKPYDDLIAINQRRIALLEEAARRLYREWFVNLRFPGHESVRIEDRTPEHWRKKTIRELCSLLSRGISPKYDTEASMIVLNQKCIRNGKISLNQARRQNKEIKPEKFVKKGDILINSTGTGTLGRIAQVIDEIKNCTADTHITIARPKNEKISLYMGQVFLNMQPILSEMGKGATNQLELSRHDIGEIEVLEPPENIQDDFNDIVHPIINLINKTQTQNITLTNARDLLLPRLMSGKLDVSNIPLPEEVLA